MFLHFAWSVLAQSSWQQQHWKCWLQRVFPYFHASSDSPALVLQQQNVVIQNISQSLTQSITSPYSAFTAGGINMRLRAASLVLLGIVASRREILKRQGDYFLRLQNQGGNLVLDEGQINLSAQYISLTHIYRRCYSTRTATEGPKHVHQKEKDCTCKRFSEVFEGC